MLRGLFVWSLSTCYVSGMEGALSGSGTGALSGDESQQPSAGVVGPPISDFQAEYQGNQKYRILFKGGSLGQIDREVEYKSSHVQNDCYFQFSGSQPLFEGTPEEIVATVVALSTISSDVSEVIEMKKVARSYALLLAIGAKNFDPNGVEWNSHLGTRHTRSVAEMAYLGGAGFFDKASQNGITTVTELKHRLWSFSMPWNRMFVVFQHPHVDQPGQPLVSFARKVRCDREKIVNSSAFQYIQASQKTHHARLKLVAEHFTALGLFTDEDLGFFLDLIDASSNKLSGALVHQLSKEDSQYYHDNLEKGFQCPQIGGYDSNALPAYTLKDPLGEDEQPPSGSIDGIMNYLENFGVEGDGGVLSFPEVRAVDVILKGSPMLSAPEFYDIAGNSVTAAEVSNDPSRFMQIGEDSFFFNNQGQVVDPKGRESFIKKMILPWLMPDEIEEISDADVRGFTTNLDEFPYSNPDDRRNAIRLSNERDMVWIDKYGRPVRSYDGRWEPVFESKPTEKPYRSREGPQEGFFNSDQVEQILEEFPDTPPTWGQVLDMFNQEPEGYQEEDDEAAVALFDPKSFQPVLDPDAGEQVVDAARRPVAPNDRGRYVLLAGR